MPSPRPRVAVILAGCGHLDGTDVHEATLSLVALDRARASLVACAPDVPLPVVIDAQRGDINPYESRNARTESARITRGPVRDLATLRLDEIDALWIPGGYGAARTLSTYATQGRGMTVFAPLAALIEAAHAARKPIGVVCLATMIAARVLGRKGVTLAGGGDAGTQADLAVWGAQIEPRTARAITVDGTHRVVSTPGYLDDAPLRDIAEGIDRGVRALMDLI